MAKRDMQWEGEEVLADDSQDDAGGAPVLGNEKSGVRGACAQAPVGWSLIGQMQPGGVGNGGYMLNHPMGNQMGAPMHGGHMMGHGLSPWGGLTTLELTLSQSQGRVKELGAELQEMRKQHKALQALTGMQTKENVRHMSWKIKMEDQMQSINEERNTLRSESRAMKEELLRAPDSVIPRSMKQGTPLDMVRSLLESAQGCRQEPPPMLGNPMMGVKRRAYDARLPRPSQRDEGNDAGSSSAAEEPHVASRFLELQQKSVGQKRRRQQSRVPEY